MRRRWTFFKEPDEALGVFYPRHCFLAAYADLGRAEEVRAALLMAGSAPDDVAAASGDFVVNELLACAAEGWIGALTRELAAPLEVQADLERDRRHAAAGGAFLFLYAPDAAGAARARSLLEASRPRHLRRYLPFGIERWPDDAAAPRPAAAAEVSRSL